MKEGWVYTVYFHSTGEIRGCVREGNIHKCSLYRDYIHFHFPFQLVNQLPSPLPLLSLLHQEEKESIKRIKRLKKTKRMERMKRMKRMKF